MQEDAEIFLCTLNARGCGEISLQSQRERPRRYFLADTTQEAPEKYRCNLNARCYRDLGILKGKHCRYISRHTQCERLQKNIPTLPTQDAAQIFLGTLNTRGCKEFPCSLNARCYGYISWHSQFKALPKRHTETCLRIPHMKAAAMILCTS